MSSSSDFKTSPTGVEQAGNGSDLSRQVTLQLSPEQYERLFFTPTPPRGETALAKKLGNPTLLGLLGFLIPYSSTIFCLIGWQGAVPPQSLIGLYGDYYFLGSIAMTIAGIAEFVLGNTFPFAVFIIYGTHWGSLAYTTDPSHNLVAGLAQEGGVNGAAWNASQGFHNVTMCLVSFTLMVATFRVNVLFTLVFLGLVFLFAFIAAADFRVASATTEADVAYITYLLKIGGGFGMLGVVVGWYLALITACESTGIPCPLPVFDLSSHVFPDKSKNQLKTDEHQA
ncbi:MAG: hypothetical protein Q9162_003369 [Coniocarpon cinnabarinum]